MLLQILTVQHLLFYVYFNVLGIQDLSSKKRSRQDVRRCNRRTKINPKNERFAWTLSIKYLPFLEGWPGLYTESFVIVFWAFFFSFSKFPNTAQEVPQLPCPFIHFSTLSLAYELALTLIPETERSVSD